MKKKLLSLLLLVSLIATMVIVPTTVSAANPWKTILNKDFSTAEQLANDGTQGGSPAGFIAHNNAFTYDAENGWLVKTNATRWDFSLGKMYTSPNVVRLSFDVMLDNTANYYFQPFANTLDGSGKYIHLTDFGGETIKRNEWQHYNIEFIPSNTVAGQKVKIWRGDESYYASAQTITYSNVHNRTNISWVRFEQKAAPTTEVLFDNFKVEQFMFLPEVKGVTFIDNLGNEITELADMTPAVSAVKVNITNAASVDEILENFWIFNETEEEEVELGEATYENNVFTIALPNGLQGGCDYSITVDAALANANGETGDGAYITFNTIYADMQAELKAISNAEYSDGRWNTILKKDFSTADQLATGGVKGGTAGFIGFTTAFAYDAENACLKKTNATRWDFSLGKMYSSPNIVRLSFDVKLDDTADYFFQPFATTDDDSKQYIRFTTFGGEDIKRNEWQRYNIEFIPSGTAANQVAKYWRGEESHYSSAKTLTYSFANNRTNISWVRFEQKVAPTTEALFDNFKIESKRLIFATDFSDPSGYAVDSNKTFEPSRKPGFQKLNGTVTSNQKFEVDASIGNLEIMRLWFAGTYGSSNPVKVSFDLKTDADNLINLLFRVGAQTDDVSDVFPINGDNIVGGEEFVPGVWQKYNFVLYPNSDVTKHYFKAWRGDSSDMATAKETSYAVGTRKNVSNISLINGDATDAGITYQIDNVIAEIFYNDGYDFTNPEITGVKATIDNSAAQSGNYWLIVAGYDSDRLDEVELKPLTLESNNKLLTDTLDVPENMKNCKNIKAFLWDSKTLEPLTGFIEVR